MIPPRLSAQRLTGGVHDNAIRYPASAARMGMEYNIHYQPADRVAWDSFVSRLANPVSDGWPAFSVELTERGVYFCDNRRSDAAAVALRRIVDEALSHSDSVVIEEAG